MRRFGAKLVRQVIGCRQQDAILLDKPAETAPVTFMAQCSGQQRQVDIASSLIPRPESSGGYIGANTFLGAALKGEFPIMNGSRAVGSEMREPTTFD